MKHTGKNPYEIRLELLQLAQLILTEQCRVAASKNGDNPICAPTSADIIAEANKLNEFVSNTSIHG